MSGGGERYKPGELILWNLETAQKVRAFDGHTDSVTGVAISADGKRLVSGSHDLTIRLWDLDGKVEPVTLRGHKAPVIAITLSADGKQLYSASIDEKIKTWDLEAAKDVSTLSCRGVPSGLVLSPNGKLLFSGGEDADSDRGKAIKAWGLEKGADFLLLSGHTGRVGAIALTADGKRLASGAADRSIRVWELGIPVNSPSPLLMPPGVSSKDAVASAFGNRLLINSFRGLFLLDLSRGTTMELKWDRSKLLIRNCVISAAGSRIAASFGGNELWFWEPDVSVEPRALGKYGDFLYEVMSHDGKMLVSVGAKFVLTDNRTPMYSPVIKLWDLDRRQEKRTLHLPILFHNRDDVKRRVQLSADCRWLVGNKSDSDQVYNVWDLETGKEAFELKDVTMYPKLEMSSDGTRLAYRSSKDDKLIRIWDLTGGKEVMTIQHALKYIRHLILTHDGSRLALAGTIQGSEQEGMTIQTWDLATGNEISTFKVREYLKSLAFSPDGKRLLSSTSGSGLTSKKDVVKLWDLEAGKETLALHDSKGIGETFVICADRIISWDSFRINIWELAPKERSRSE